MSQTPIRSEPPLFYASPIPLDREAHRDLRTGSGVTDYGFARGTHFIPALIDEFSPASRELPIVFVPSQTGPAAVFMVGLESGRNELVSPDGAWTGGYVPAYLRRYPFILGEVEGADPIVCIDEANTVLSRTEGEPLFDEAGEPSPALGRAIDFTNEYFAAGRRTERFVEMMLRLGLFRSVTVEAKDGKGGSNTIHGLLAIDEEKLYELSDADFLELRRERVLAPIFAHFFSLTQIEKLRSKAEAPTEVAA